MLLDFDAVRTRPDLSLSFAQIAPEELWAVFSSPWIWFCEREDWTSHWDSILRKCAEVFNGYHVHAMPIRIPTALVTGEYFVNWNIPFRRYVILQTHSRYA